MTQKTIEIKVLTASDGMVLTNGETYSTQVYLGIHDSPDNWHEIPEADIPTANDEEVS
ncbi:MAG: hypothetical protein II875_10340 [Clostridia bacterium]|nr:hypothetical protein [Clostridia bacterium]